MKIGVDLRPLQKETQFRGIGIYLRQLLLALSQLKNNHDYVFFVEQSLPDPNIMTLFKRKRVVRLRPNRLARIRFIRAFVPKNRVIKTSSAEVDVLLEADGELGAPKDLRSVLVFHDIIPMLFRDDEIIKQSTGFRKLKRQLASALYGKKYAWFLQQYAKVSHILAISRNSLEDLRRYLPETKNVPATVIYHGGLQNKKGSEKRPASVPENSLFLLYVGGIDVRKNIMGLLRDFLETKKTYPNLKLVLVGKEFELTSQLNDLGWGKLLRGHENSIIKTGFVSDEELMWLYKHASAFVFPSRYEGFGMPILEAMDAECPVITYKNSSIPEVAGDAALLINDGESMVPAILKLLKDQTLRKKLSSKGVAQAAQFTWHKTATQTLDLLERVARETK